MAGQERRRTGRRVVTTALGCSAALVVAGGAYAYWSNFSANTGHASTADGLATFTTTATVAQGALLYPGGTAPLTVDVDNSGNTYSLTLTAVSLDSSRSITVDASHAAACTNPAISVTTPGSWGGLTVGAGASSGPVTIVDAVAMGAASNGCQGATFTIPVTLTGLTS